MYVCVYVCCALVQCNCGVGQRSHTTSPQLKLSAQIVCVGVRACAHACCECMVCTASYLSVNVSTSNTSNNHTIDEGKGGIRNMNGSLDIFLWRLLSLDVTPYQLATLV